jgi:CHAT domain-containing protein
MTPTPEVQERIRRYLLGQLTDGAREEIEQDLLANGELFEELLVVEDELIDEYLAGKLGPDERSSFERHFLATAERHEKLKFGRAFDRYLSSQARPVTVREPKLSRTPWAWTQAFLSYPVRIAACALVVVLILLGVWRVSFHQSEVDKGLLALNAAYREQRPIESRISRLDYAPFSQTRGGPERVDSLARTRAEAILSNAVNERPNATSLHALGRVYLAKKQFDDAIKEFEEAIKSDPKNARLHSDLGAAWLEKGKLDLDKARADSKNPSDGKGLEEFGRSLENLNKALELDPDLLEALFNRALLYQYLMVPREAEASWREYIKRDANSPWVDEAKRNLKQLEENNRRTTWNAGEALKDFLEARNAGDDDAAWRILTQNYTSAGNEVTNSIIDYLVEPTTAASLTEPLPVLSYVAKLELDRGGDHYTSDLASQYRRQESGRRQILTEARRQMKVGYALFTQSKFAEAVKAYSEATGQYAQLGDSTEQAFAEYRLAHCYLFLPDLEKAKTILESASVICNNHEYRWLAAQCLYGLSHACADKSEYSRAIDYSDQALTGFERAGDLNGVLKSLTQLADVNQALNRIDKSLGYLSRGLALTSEAPTEPMQRWGMLVQIAFSMSSRELHQAALIYQKEALDIALKMGRPLVISRSYGYVGSEYAAMKMYAEGVNAATRAVETGASMAEGPGALEIIANASQQLGDIRRRAGECDKAIETYDRSIDIYSRLKFDYYSYAAHKGKLLCFLAASNDLAARDELQKVLALSEKYRSKITVESQRLSFFATEQSVYDLAIYYELARMKDPIKAFEYSEVSRARSLLDEIRRGAQVLRKSAEPDLNLPAVTRSMSPTEIQENMPTESQILQYAVLDDRLLMWVITKSAIRHQEVSVGAEQLTERVRTYLEAVNKPQVGNVANETGRAEDLFRILVAPVEPFLDKSKYLCIVPDKILHYLPYHALISPATARYLIEDYDIGTAPSASTFVYLTQSAQRKAGTFDEKLLSVGNPHFSHADFDSLAELPSAATEAESVSALYKKSRVLLQEEATETAIRSEIEKADVAHLAAHYILNDRLEMLSGFPLAAERPGSRERESSNGFLQSYEIYDLKLPRTRLVILSGCRTGIEQQYKGEGAVSVARPFIVAGVPTVVASLWPVDSDASAELMANFHRHRIRDRLPVTQALRRAQIEMARGQDLRYQDPYYWAPFVAIGGHASY